MEKPAPEDSDTPPEKDTTEKAEIAADTPPEKDTPEKAEMAADTTLQKDTPEKAELAADQEDLELVVAEDPKKVNLNSGT